MHTIEMQPTEVRVITDYGRIVKIKAQSDNEAHHFTHATLVDSNKFVAVTQKNGMMTFHKIVGGSKKKIYKMCSPAYGLSTVLSGCVVVYGNRNGVIAIIAECKKDGMKELFSFQIFPNDGIEIKYYDDGDIVLSNDKTLNFYEIVKVLDDMIWNAQPIDIQVVQSYFDENSGASISLKQYASIW